MNIQIEHLEDQTARVTVEVETERLEDAKHRAGRQISRKVNIPGFRKGKVPYRILVTYVGEAAIMEDAVDLLSQELYKEALPQTDLEPYGPGVLTDVKSDQPAPTFIYTVPLQPTVDLAGYRDIREPYEVPEVTDEAVKRALKNLQEQQAVVEESQQPAALGNRVTIDVHSFVLEEHEAEEEEAEATPEAEADAEVEAEAEAETLTDEHDHEEEHDHDHDHHDHDEEGQPYLHEHDLQLLLDEDDEPQPGFNDELVGANVGDAREFELTFPDDAEEYEDMAGKQVRYYVTVKKIESLTMPELTDDLAARVTQDEEKPLTLLELRMRIRENLVKMGEDNYRSEYTQQVLDKMVEQSDIKFPEAMVIDQVDRFLQDLDQRLRRQGITLQDYMKIYQKTADDLYAEYRDPASQTVRRSLVLREVANVEAIDVTDEDIDAQIDKIVEQFGEDQRDNIRRMFTGQSGMRDSVLNDLMRDKVLDRIAAIAQGEAPTLAAAEVTNEETATDNEESA